MEISKQELLKIANISYGQLYRWKRQGLLPESWFVKKSTFTGQETFFDKEKIVERISKIKELKKTHSIDQIVNMFTETNDNKISGINNISEIPSFLIGEAREWTIRDAAMVLALTSLPKICDIAVEKLIKLKRELLSNFKPFSEISIIELAGSYIVCSFVQGSKIDSRTKEIYRFNVDDFVVKIKTKYPEIIL